MKLALGSLATGIVVTIGLFLTVVFVRALLKDDASTMVFLWLFAWPVWILRLVPGISAGALIWLSLAIGLGLDIVLVSLATYVVLRAFVSRQKRTRTAIPPQPPTF